MENIEQRVKKIVAEQLGVNEADVKNESSFVNDLGADSLDLVELVMRFEEEFDIEIVSSVPQKFPATKGMVIQITDPKLLKSTGGIVQGMSGSPIIQNDKIIGAVTHVFVNDPTSGYGVHIEWMLHQAGINIYDQEKKAS